LTILIITKIVGIIYIDLLFTYVICYSSSAAAIDIELFIIFFIFRINITTYFTRSNPSMACVDNKLLECIFEPKYIDFQLAERLEVVSGLFQRFTNSYLLKMKFVDLKLLAGINSIDEIELSRRIFKYCANLVSIRNVEMSVDNVEWLD